MVMNCKGLIYRYRKNAFMNNRGDMVETKTVSLLKRESCKGHHSGGCWLNIHKDELKEYIANDGELPEIPSDAEDYDKLRLKTFPFCDELEELWFEVVKPGSVNAEVD